MIINTDGREEYNDIRLKLWVVLLLCNRWKGEENEWGLEERDKIRVECGRKGDDDYGNERKGKKYTSEWFENEVDE